jgi:hypothetical protein
VTWEALVDAVAHAGAGQKGAAKVARLPDDVCSHPYADGLDEQQTNLFLSAAGGLVGGQSDTAPKVPKEPKVRKVFREPAP